MKCMVFLNHQRQTYLPIKNNVPQNQVVSVNLYIPLYVCLQKNYVFCNS